MFKRGRSKSERSDMISIGPNHAGSSRQGRARRKATARAAVTALVAAAALVVSAPASAGYAWPATAACMPGYITVHPPTMYAASNGFLINGVWYQNPLQQVAYRAHLWYKNASGGWTHWLRGPLRTAWVSSTANGTTTWFDGWSGVAIRGTSSFDFSSRGTFRVSVEYFWYAFPNTNYGSDYGHGWVDHFDYRRSAYGLAAQEACAY